ncbi:hypothetical protein FCV25MIE_00794 [Fagus crenata]
MESDPTDMETTEIMAEDNSIADISAKKSVTFEDQLREIDLALNFTPLVPEILGTAGKEKSIRHEEWIGPGSPAQTINKDPYSSMGLRSPLGDITNDDTLSTQKPKVGTWKKKGRAKGQGSNDLRIFTVAEKRISEAAFQLEDGDPRCLKNARRSSSYHLGSFGQGSGDYKLVTALSHVYGGAH